MISDYKTILEYFLFEYTSVTPEKVHAKIATAS